MLNCLVSYDISVFIKDWDSNVDKGVRKILERLDWEDIGAGAGFGQRDLEFVREDTEDLQTNEELRQIIVDKFPELESSLSVSIEEAKDD